MRAVMVMYDSLRWDLLPCFGGKEVELPNFQRLAEHSVAFENSYVCSMPCMPARRELHTGRPNFLHRSWGPIEPFDDSMPELLKANGIYTRIVTDHSHYVEDGGATYCTRYSTWECNRGQEGDPWQASAGPLIQSPNAKPIPEEWPPFLKNEVEHMRGQDVLNRKVCTAKDDYPQAKTFAQGVQFLKENAKYDNWFLQIETFDPHEPFDVPDQYCKKFFDKEEINRLDWPPYDIVTESEEEIYSFRAHYLALLSFCDECLGKVLDQFDENDLWKDTMLIVNTDHGYLLSEHGWWAKSTMPDYQEIVHTPLFIWDPRCGKRKEHRQALVQTIDLAPTLLDFFGVEVPKDMTGKVLRACVEKDEPVREYAIFGYHAGAIDITDGRYKLILNPKQDCAQMYEYTLMPTHMRTLFQISELQQAELVEPFGFTKGCKVLRIPCSTKWTEGLMPGEELLFDLQQDPKEMHPIQNTDVKSRLKTALAEILKENEAPAEIFNCYNL